VIEILVDDDLVQEHMERVVLIFVSIAAPKLGQVLLDHGLVDQLDRDPTMLVVSGAAIDGRHPTRAQGLEDLIGADGRWRLRSLHDQDASYQAMGGGDEQDRVTAGHGELGGWAA
jgi:hypothetical protein